MGLKRTTDAATEPLTTAEAKTHLRIDGSDEDTHIDGLIQAARIYCEDYQQRAYITQTWSLSLRQFPANRTAAIRIPRPPLIAFTGDIIAYSDTAGDAQTLALTTDFVLNTADPTRPHVEPAYGVTWPGTRESPTAVVITYTAGYGAAAAVPQNVKQAMLLLIGHWFENRESVVTGMMAAQVPQAVEHLLDHDRVMEYA